MDFKWKIFLCLTLKDVLGTFGSYNYDYEICYKSKHLTREGKEKYSTVLNIVDLTMPKFPIPRKSYNVQKDKLNWDNYW